MPLNTIKHILSERSQLESIKKEQASKPHVGLILISQFAQISNLIQELLEPTSTPLTKHKPLLPVKSKPFLVKEQFE
jgi:hypothetical protein